MVLLLRSKYPIQKRGEHKMIDTNKLKGVIAERGMSQRKVAKALGITEKTFYLKMKNGVFDSDEIAQMIKLLNISNPLQIFFADLVTY